MASKRRPLHSNPNSKLNFRPPTSNENFTEGGKGTKPLPDPTSVQNILLYIVQHACKKLLFMDTNKRVLLYFGIVFFLSLVTDFIPTPKTYFSRKDNIFNQYFVKIAWGWTLLFASPFVALSSFTYCCGKRERVIRHCSRLVIATLFWYFWTNLYNYVENTYGKCNLKDAKFQTKSACLGKGFHWQSVDISGHTFILIYSTLMLIEEARIIVCWEGITDLIRDEEYARAISDKSARINPLRNLCDEDFSSLKVFYFKFSPYIRALFVCITVLALLWDLMLLSTVLYFHNMLEKLLACMVAVLTWFVTYRCWYPLPKVLPEMPGVGLFKYKDIKLSQEPKLKARASFTAKVPPGPRFMGMPLKVPSAEESAPTQDEEKSNGIL